MIAGRIVIVSGPPGSGKTTLSRLLAETSPFAQAVHLHTDDFYSAIVKGFIPPWLPEASAQNEAIAHAAAACAAEYARAGLEVLVDGVIGPWLLAPWQAIANVHVHYVVLRTPSPTLIERVLARPLGKTRLHPRVVESMARQFAELGDREHHALPAEGLTLDQTAAAIRTRMDDGSLRL